MTSRDGVHWDRTFPEAWLRPGRDPRNWTQRGNMVARGILETEPDEFSLYVSEHYEWPDNRLRRISVRRHGFGSVHAGALGGELITRPLVNAGKRLALNFATSAAGSVRVELQDAHGSPISGYSLDDCPEIYGDEIAHTVAWRTGADLSRWAGQSVRLRFALSDADLFALQFV